ncbi:Tigger transposable element-derived protein 6 [Araneus ventricosus]|uniref:Tigger transposable element-derived protein 6 n=1 Tax=Araneus ventricosus TaxID=182803 RepID=A0A4Y2AXU1_ARAVE|nr:Tigger transposable element-derived protein 6 [Araneus ventricosus]
MRDKNVPISGPFIIEKALQFAKALGYDDFQESNGWLEKFKRRHRIMAKVISGDSKHVDNNDRENWITETISKILKDYKPENIFNADETALFFNVCLKETLTFKKEKCFGRKQSKARLTVMLGANKIGHQKLRPLVIGRSKNPKSFKGVKSLGVDYDFNKKSWMTSEICEKRVQKLDKLMIAECRKIAFVFDNCPAYPKEINQKLKNFTVFYLPPSTPSKLQPMDQRVIKNFKIHYCKGMVRKVITVLENNQSMPKINSRESKSEISKAWKYDVTDRTIRNSFAKAGFFVSNENSASTEDEDDIPLEELKKMWIQPREKEEINDDVLIDDFLSLDSEAETSETITELDILDSVKNKNNTAMNCDKTKMMKMEMIMKKSTNLRMMKC